MNRTARAGFATLLFTSAGLTAGLLTGAAQAAVTIPVSNACDLSVVPPGDGGVAGTVEAAPGDTVQLTANSTCVPVIGDVTDPDTGVTAPGLVSGDGITVAAPGVILDLNGFDIHSSKDVLAAAQARGLDIENAGVAVGANNVLVTNRSANVTLVDNFTANFDFAKGSNNSTLRGTKSPTSGYNLRGGNAHGGGVLAVDRTQGITIDTVRLVDRALQRADAIPGDNGIDWKRCTGSGNTLKNSVVQAPLAGMRVRGCTFGTFTVNKNRLTSSDPAGVGLEFTRDVNGATVTGNVISGNGADGVSVRAANNAISITGNRIQNNGGAGILVSAQATNITTAPNTFGGNVGGDVVIN